MIRILVITSDDERTRSIVDHLQSRNGWEALSAGSGEDGLRQLEDDESIQFLIVDLGREDLAGDTFIRRARRRQPALSCLLLGGSEAWRAGLASETQMRSLPDSATLEEVAHGVDELVELARGRGFHGHLQCLSLIDIIQLHCATAKTGRLRVQHWGQNGEVFFSSGNLLHARHADLEGPEALYRLVSWDSGVFRVDLDTLPEVDTLSHMPLSALLIEATRRHDEALAPNARTQTATGEAPMHRPGTNGRTKRPKLELPAADALPRRRLAPLSADLVNDLLEVDGVEGIFAVNREGIMLQAEDVDDSEGTLGTLAAYLGSSCESTQETFGADRFTTALAVERSGRKLLLINTRNFYIGVIGSVHALADPLQRDVLESIRRAATGKARRARPRARIAAPGTGDEETAR